MSYLGVRARFCVIRSDLLGPIILLLLCKEFKMISLWVMFLNSFWWPLFLGSSTCLSSSVKSYFRFGTFFVIFREPFFWKVVFFSPVVYCFPKHTHVTRNCIFWLYEQSVSLLVHWRAPWFDTASLLLWCFVATLVVNLRGMSSCWRFFQFISIAVAMAIPLYMWAFFEIDIFDDTVRILLLYRSLVWI